MSDSYYNILDRKASEYISLGLSDGERTSRSNGGSNSSS
jgi:hypothetical protein